MIVDLPSWEHFGTHEQSAYPELWDGVRAYYAPCLGPTGTRLADLGGSSNWGTLTNMDAATDWVVDAGRYALDFDSSNDFVSVGTTQYLFLNRPFSLSWWERVTANTNTFPARFRLRSNTNTFAVIASTSVSYSSFGWGEWKGQQGVRASGATLPSNRIGQWYHYALIGLAGPQSGNTADYVLYENGRSVSLAISAAFGNFAGTINQIGWDSLDNGADCLMDQIVIRDLAINPTLVLREYQIGRGGMLTPRRRRRAYFVQTFSPSWAAGSNVVLQPSIGVS